MIPSVINERKPAPAVHSLMTAWDFASCSSANNSGMARSQADVRWIIIGTVFERSCGLLPCVSVAAAQSLNQRAKSGFFS